MTQIIVTADNPVAAATGAYRQAMAMTAEAAGKLYALMTETQALAEQVADLETAQPSTREIARTVAMRLSEEIRRFDVATARKLGEAHAE